MEVKIKDKRTDEIMTVREYCLRLGMESCHKIDGVFKNVEDGEVRILDSCGLEYWIAPEHFEYVPDITQPRTCETCKWWNIDSDDYPSEDFRSCEFDRENENKFLWSYEQIYVSKDFGCNFHEPASASDRAESEK